MDFSDYNSENKYNRMLAYSRSKLSNIYHAISLSEKYEKKGIKAVSLHPGININEKPYFLGAIRTEINRYLLASPVVKICYLVIYPFYLLFTKSAE